MAVPDSRRIQSLSGPISFYYYPNISGKRILLLGDYHAKVNMCSSAQSPEIQSWLKQLALDAPSCLDNQ